MKVILIKDVDKLGKKGDIKEVSEGFGRNFLFPQRLVMEATKSNIKLIEEGKKKEAKMFAAKKSEFEALADKINKLTVTISKQVGEEDKMFGAVTSEEIAEAIKAQGVEIDKRKIDTEPIKTLGTIEVPVRLHPEVTAKIKVIVVKA